MRLDKFLAQAGIGKRKEVRIYIKEGLVKVNEKIELIPAVEISEEKDRVEFNGNRIIGKEKVYYMLNKPAGYITATKDEEHKTIFDLFKEDMEGVFHVGRLDKDTEGLLILTNDGEIEHRIMYPEKHVNKTYFFIALGKLSNEDIRELENGVYINKGAFLTKKAKVENITNIESFNRFKNELKKKLEKVVEYKEQNFVFGKITIQEGKKHQVKKMLKAVGAKIIYLERIGIGGLKLDESLKRGEYKKISESDLEKIFQSNIEEKNNFNI